MGRIVKAFILSLFVLSFTSLIYAAPGADAYGNYNGTPVTIKVESDGTVVTSGTVSELEELYSSDLVVKTVDIATGQTASTVWDPTTGTRFVITDMIISSSAAGVLTLFDGTDNTTLRVAKLNLSANGGAVVNYKKPYISATVDNILKYTSDTTFAGSLTVSGYEK